MKRMTAVFVAVMVLLAGCGGGGNGTASPAPTTMTESTSTADAPSTDTNPPDSQSPDSTPTESTPTDTPPPDDPDDDSDTGDEPELNESAQAALQAAFNETGSYGGPYRLDLTLVNGSRETHLTIINDTEEELTTYNRSTFSGPTTYYVTDGPDAVRNRTSGETRYGTGESVIEQSVGFIQAFTLLAAFVYIGVLDWQPAGETTVDGETAYVFEADSLNQSAFEGDDGFTVDPDEVNAAEGEMVLSSRGIHSLSITIDTPDGTVGVDMDVEIGDDIDVERPDWVDDSEFDD